MSQDHINVEWCHSVKSIKYICKYIKKGSDQAIFQLQNTAYILDEVQSFLLGRYISSNEAVWRILGFPIHQRYPTVVHLSVHLENGQRIYFTAGNLQQLQAAPHTTLTAFFHPCRQMHLPRCSSTVMFLGTTHGMLRGNNSKGVNKAVWSNGIPVSGRRRH
jgi:hypothetical protein